MNRKNIFKMLAAAMLMPAMLLTTACSSEDDALNTPTENIAKKGYIIPVTINVTRQGDAAGTRASFNETSKKLEFTTGDKLYVSGSNTIAGQYAGTLDYDAVSGKFSGIITTKNEYTGTIEAGSYAILLPNGYESYGFFSYTENNGYDAALVLDYRYAFSLTKAAAVEQFSLEVGSYTSGTGFTLTPNCAVLNFTINGLAASNEVTVVFNDGSRDVSGNVTTDASGTATFAIGLLQNINLNKCTLTVDGNAITLVSESKVVEAGKIYNITRSAAAAAGITNPAVGQVIGSDGKNYAVDATLPTGVTKVAMIAYVSGSNGLAIQLSSSPESKNWAGANTYAEGLNTSTPIAGGTWRLPSKADWQNMFVGCAVSGDASASDEMNPIAGFKAKIAATGTTWQSGDYWSSTPSGSLAWRVNVGLNGGDAYALFYEGGTSYSRYVLGCLAF